jgi:hypothetical protein
MATRSAIAIQETKEGPVRYVYCHFDGYPAHNGKILNEHYRDPSKVKELLALGDMSSLGETVDKSIFYCRDRKERLTLRSQISLKELAQDDNYAYHYVLKEQDGEWKWFLPVYKQGTLMLVPVETAIESNSHRLTNSNTISV